jgi:hypothetical protein
VDDLLQTALLGTAKHPAPPADHPADALAAGLKDQSAERHLLLRAGARTVHHLAGFVPPQAEAIQVAPPDTRPVCSRRAAQILADWIAAHQHELLIEAYQRLDRAGQRLRPELLHRALMGCIHSTLYTSAGSGGEKRTTHVVHRYEQVYQALSPVLGERGRWFYPFHQEYLRSAASDTAPGTGSANPSPNADEERWKEAPHPERRWTLETLRQTDPDRARQWLMAAWSTEKAEHRAEFLETLATGLSGADEEFLNQALDDRSAAVRSVAAKLLARLPGSALSRKVRETAEGILAYTSVVVRRKPAAAPTTPSARGLIGTLTVTLPLHFDKTWKRLGIEEKPPAGKGARAFWASQVLALVPPSHWEAHFQAPVTELIEAAEGCDDGPTVLEAWSEAALLFEEQPWVQALWDRWYRRKSPKKPGPGDPDASSWLLRLAQKMEDAELEQRAIRFLEELHDDRLSLLAKIMEDLRRPWGVVLARKYLVVLRGYRTQLARDHRSQNYYLDETIYPAAVSLPAACFEEALQGWDLLPVEGDKPSSGRRMADTALDKFLGVVRLRKEFRDQVASVTATGDHP